MKYDAFHAAMKNKFMCYKNTDKLYIKIDNPLNKSAGAIYPDCVKISDLTQFFDISRIVREEVHDQVHELMISLAVLEGGSASWSRLASNKIIDLANDLNELAPIQPSELSSLISEWLTGRQVLASE